MLRSARHCLPLALLACLLVPAPAGAAPGVEQQLKTSKIQYEKKGTDSYVVTVELGMGKSQSALVYWAKAGKTLETVSVLLPVISLPEGTTPSATLLKAMENVQENFVTGRLTMREDRLVIFVNTYIFNGTSAETLLFNIASALKSASVAEKALEAALEEE